MKRTISSRSVSKIVGDYRAYCDICGLPFRRSNLRRDSMRRALCDDCYESRDEYTIQLENDALQTRRDSVRKHIMEYRNR